MTRSFGQGQVANSENGNGGLVVHLDLGRLAGRIQDVEVRCRRMYSLWMAKPLSSNTAARPPIASMRCQGAYGDPWDAKQSSERGLLLGKN